jgi:tetratricopeptide (TPR) repeat protein
MPAHESRPTETAHRTLSRRRRWLLVALVLLAAGAAGWWWLRRPALPDPPMPADIQSDEVREAIATARKAVLAAPRSEAAWGHLAEVLLAQQFDREADACLITAMRLNPREPRWLYARCIIALKRDPDHAVEMLRHATEVADAASSPVYSKAARLLLAEALLERGDLDEAEAEFRAVEARAADDPRVALGLGLVAFERGDDATARQYLSATLNSPHARKLATSRLAQIAHRRGEKAEAAQYDRIWAKLPNDQPWPDALLDDITSMAVGQRGWERQVKYLEQEKRYREAAELYLQRAERHPSVEDYTGAGMNFARLREYDRAFALLQQAVQLDPNNANAQYTLALVMFARAEREWESTPGAEQLKTWLRQAMEHAKRAAELRPGHGKTYMVWGMALVFLGEPEQAIAPLRMGVACQPVDLELQLGLGRALLEAGHSAEARTHLENARRLAPPNDPRPGRLLERLQGKQKS